jgi:hypothetical protein
MKEWEHERFNAKNTKGEYMFTKLNPEDKHSTCNYCNYIGCSFAIDKYGPIGHWVWVVQHYSRKHAWKLNPIRVYRHILWHLTALDYSKIADVEVDGIDTRDYPDFCDAFIASATYKGLPMTDSQLDRLNDDKDYVYEEVMAHLY